MNLSNFAMALFAVTSAFGVAAAYDPSADPYDPWTGDPSPPATGTGIENPIEVIIDYKDAAQTGACPTTADGKAAVLADGDGVCAATSTALSGSATGVACTATVKNYSCKEKTTTGTTPTTTHDITAVLELDITTYCTTANNHVDCTPDSVKALNDAVEAAVKAVIPAGALDEFVADLYDDLTDWYPKWTGSTSECLNDGKYPDYMKAGILKSTLESCCASYYGWEKDVCTANSGGDTSDLENGKFYIDWNNIKGGGEGYCVRSCLKTGSATSFDNCGGLHERWETPYDTAAACCDVMKLYVNKEYCIAKSEGGPDATFTNEGSGEWYVDGNDCKRDCTDTGLDECDALPLDDTWTQTYEDMDECCKRLTWLTDDSGNCPAQADYGNDNA